jgi:DNA-binding SARP family transcriptional activator/ABC-type oligopeptide transport system substrate-binding subunit/streptogramin lyase
MDYRILGPLEVADGERIVPIGAGRPRALLALLLLHRNQTVPTDRLIDELWGESPPPTAAKILQNVVSQLRRALGDEALVTANHGYALRVAPGAVDVDEFEQAVAEARMAGDPAHASAGLSRALALWRGPALGELASEPFARAEASRLEERRAVAFEERIDADLALGRHEDLVGELEAAVALEPLRERRRAQLMLALYRSGRQAEALGAYRDARHVLVGELGLEPGPELQRLESAILRQDPALELRATAPRAPPSASGRRPVAVLLLAAGGLIIATAAVAAILSLRPSADEGLAAISGDAVAVVDASRERIVAQVPLEAPPGLIASGQGAVWIADVAGRRLFELDPRTRRLARRSVSLPVTPAGLAAGAGAVWVTDAGGPTLLRVDPRYGTVERIRLRRDRFGSSARGVAVGAGSVWVALGYPGVVERVDPVRRDVTRVIPVMGAGRLAFGEGMLWAGAYDVTGRLVQIDPRSNTANATGPRFGDEVTGLAVGGGHAWAAIALDDTVWKVNVRGLAVGSYANRNGPAGVAYASGAAWVASPRDHSLTRIDNVDDGVSTIRMGNAPGDVTALAGTVWVAGSHLLHGGRGGDAIARIAVPFYPGTDPATADPYYPAVQQLTYATCAKLMNYPDASAPAGTHLQPEVAAAPPEVSADGRTYTFRVRPGFRFSPPSNEPVTAETFRASIERALSPGLGRDAPAIAFAHDVVGADAYHAGRARTLAGVSTAGDRLRIRLTAPAGDLPARLALPQFCAVPSDTPVEPNGLTEAIPSAGPYFVAGAELGRQLTVRRNPNYRGTRPHRIAGFDYIVGLSTREAVDRVRAGTIDYTALGGRDLFEPQFQPGGRYDREFGRAAGPAQRYFLQPTQTVRALALNTSRPLFRDSALRRAVGFALDRAALAGRFGARPTDQYLPPTMRGFRDERIFPLAGPDLAAARALAGSRRRTAVLWTCSGIVCRSIGEIVRSNLAPLGLRVRIRQLDDPWGIAGGRRGADYDLLDVFWTPDRPDPAAVLEPLLDGAGLGPDGNTNLSYFDDPATNARLTVAGTLSGDARYRAYGALDVAVARDDAPLAAFAVDNVAEFLAPRLGCSVFQPTYGGLSLGALCLRRSPHR